METRTAESKERLDRFLLQHLPGVTRSRIAQHIAAGLVLVNDEPALKAGHMLRPGWAVSWRPIEEKPPHALEPVPMDLDVRFEDASMLIINKPRGLAIHPAPGLAEPTLVHGLLARSHDLSEGSAPYRPGIVHRLDKDTTGLIMVAKTNAAHASLAKQIADRTAVRRYLCLTAKSLPQPRMTIDAPIGRHPKDPMRRAAVEGGKPAITHLLELGHAGPGWLVAASLETGRTHQIRVHLQAIQAPVIGDPIYAGPALQGPPLQLHAALLRVTHPETGVQIEVFADPPEDFQGGIAGWEKQVGAWSPPRIRG